MVYCKIVGGAEAVKLNAYIDAIIIVIHVKKKSRL